MWILASRGRPDNLKRFIDAYIETEASSPVYVRLDTCDSKLREYKKINYPSNFKVVIGSRARLGQAMKELYETHPDLDWYGLLADDVVPKTKHWDKIMIESAGTNKISGANDGHGGVKNLCHPVVGGDLVRAVGWFSFPWGIHYCLELPWKALVFKDKSFGVYLWDVVLAHEHYRYDKSRLDKTYREAKTVKYEDIKHFNYWKKKEFASFFKKCLTVKE